MARRLATLLEGPIAPASPGGGATTFVGLDWAMRSVDATWPSGSIDHERWAAELELLGSDRVSVTLRPVGALLEVAIADDACSLTLWSEVGSDQPTVLGYRSLVEALTETSVGHEVLGFVHVDTSEDPYRWAVLDRSVGPRWDPARHAPGYYAALLLSQGHLDALGGREVALAAAPVARALGIGEDQALLELAADPTALDADAYERWRTYLAPLLPRGFRSPSPSPATRFQRPTWVLEGPPVPDRAYGCLVRGEPSNADHRWPSIEGEAVADVAVRWSGEGLDPGAESTARAVVRAWGLLAEQGFGRPRRRPAAVSVEDGAGRASVRLGGDEEAVALAVDHLAEALAATAAEVDPDGSGPFGRIELVAPSLDPGTS
ncbi:MAG: hypothetical protein R2702_12180 [Acidimicrobiales bacterium]